MASGRLALVETGQQHGAQVVLPEEEILDAWLDSMLGIRRHVHYLAVHSMEAEDRMRW